MVDRFAISISSVKLRGGVEIFNLTVNLSISYCSSVTFCFIYFDVLIAYICGILISS